MGVCGCGSENEFFQVDDNNELIMEQFEDCPDCEGQNIQIHILKKKDKDCLCEGFCVPEEAIEIIEVK